MIRRTFAKIADWSLRRKLLCSYLLVLVIPMLLLSTNTVRNSRAFVMENANVALGKMVERSEEVFVLKVEQLGNMFMMCAFERELQTVYQNKYESNFDRYLGIQNTLLPFLGNVYGYCADDIETLCVYSAMGLQKNGRHLDSADAVREEAWYETAMAHRGVLWLLEEDELFAVCRIDPLRYGMPSDPMGVVYCKLDLDRFMNNYMAVNWDTYRLEILLADGTVAQRWDVGEAALLQDSARQLSFSFDWPQQGWTFRYSIPHSTVAGLYAGRALATDVLLIAVSAALLIGLILWMTRAILRQVNYLRDRMLAVQQGNLHIEVSSTAQDEIGMLTNTFGTMLSDLRALMAREKEAQAQLSGLEMRALRAQIDPHFLYNALSHINWLALQSDNEEISDTVLELSRFYRTCLNDGKELITAGKEMENIRAYLHIQLLLHADSFDASVLLDESMAEQKMLNFLLQPLVENAIVHGVDKKTDGRAWLRVRGFLREGMLVFEIEDNGPGLAPDADMTDLRNRDKPRGYGATNIAQRIALFYGSAYGLAYGAGEAGGCRVTVTLPVCGGET